MCVCVWNASHIFRTIHVKKERVVLWVDRCDVICTLHVLLTPDLLTAKIATAPMARQDRCGSKSIQFPHELTEHKIHSPNSIRADSLKTQNAHTQISPQSLPGVYYLQTISTQRKFTFNRCWMSARRIHGDHVPSVYTLECGSDQIYIPLNIYAMWLYCTWCCLWIQWILHHNKTRFLSRQIIPRVEFYLCADPVNSNWIYSAQNQRSFWIQNKRPPVA